MYSETLVLKFCAGNNNLENKSHYKTPAIDHFVVIIEA